MAHDAKTTIGAECAAEAGSQDDGATLLAIGPEGGFNEFEVEQFEKQGFERVGLGERILRVDVAATYAAARLCP